MWTIYKHTFPNGKVYIGQTKTKLNRRFENGHGYDNCPLMAKAIQKYGWDTVQTEILQDNISSQHEADELEKYFINLYDSCNSEKGYNLAIGGRGIINQINDERIIKLWNEGNNLTQIKEKLQYDMQTLRLYLDSQGVTAEDREQRKNEYLHIIHQKYDYYQIYLLWEQGKNYKEIMELIGCKKHTIQRALTKYNISVEERSQRGQELSLKNKTDRKKINQFDKEGKFIRSFNSISEANRFLGKPANSSNITQVCKGKRQYAYGYKWEYSL